MSCNRFTRLVNGSLGIWKFLVLLVCQVWKRFNSDNCADLAAGVSFYFVLSLFPFFLVIAALIGRIPTTEWGAFADWVITYFPEDSRRLLLTNMLHLSQNYGRFLSFGLILYVWSASSGFYNLMRALTIAYNFNDTRSYWRRRIVAVCTTLVAALFLLACFSIWNLGHIFIGMFSADLHFIAVLARWVLVLLRWIITIGLIWLGIDLLTYFLPGKARPWHWVTPGAALIALASVCGIGLFDSYIAHNSEIPRIYGTLAGFVVLMLWIYTANLVLIVGAETDSAFQALSKRQSLRGLGVRAVPSAGLSSIG